MSSPERIWVRAHEAFDEDPCFPPSFGEVPQYIRADLAESPTLPKIIAALGWQGGTVDQVVAEVVRMKKFRDSVEFYTNDWDGVDYQDREMAQLAVERLIGINGLAIVHKAPSVTLGQGVAALLPEHEDSR